MKHHHVRHRRIAAWPPPKLGATHCILGHPASDAQPVDGGIGRAQACGLPVILEGARPLPHRAALRPRSWQCRASSSMVAAARSNACGITVACDVTNPLYGRAGAAPIYGPQKGATPEAGARIGRGPAPTCRSAPEKIISEAETAGAGAAGGLGFGMLAWFGADARQRHRNRDPRDPPARPHRHGQPVHHDRRRPSPMPQSLHARRRSASQGCAGTLGRFRAVVLAGSLGPDLHAAAGAEGLTAWFSIWRSADGDCQSPCAKPGPACTAGGKCVDVDADFVGSALAGCVSRDRTERAAVPNTRGPQTAPAMADPSGVFFMQRG